MNPTPATTTARLGRPPKGDSTRKPVKVWLDTEARARIEGDKRPGESLGDVVTRWGLERTP